MKRRATLIAATATLASPWQAFGQVANARLGWLSGTRRNVYERVRSWFSDQMRRHGWTEGSNLTVEVRGVVTSTPLAAAPAELVALKPDVLVTGGTAQVKMLADLTKQIPIVMIGAADPVGSGFAATLSRPGGNITGVSTVQDELWAKVLSLMHEWVPQARRIDLLADAANPSTEKFSRVTTEVARSRGLTSQTLIVRIPEDLEPTISGTHADALVIGGGPMLFTSLERVASVALRRRLPTIMSGGAAREGAAAGLLCSYDVNNEEAVRRAADCTHRILRGAKPADIPIEQPTRFEYVINVRTARAIGVAIPKTHLLRADEMIE